MQWYISQHDNLQNFHFLNLGATMTHIHATAKWRYPKDLYERFFTASREKQCKLIPFHERRYAVFELKQNIFLEFLVSSCLSFMSAAYFKTATKFKLK